MSISESDLLCYLVEWYRPELTAESLDHTAAMVSETAARMRAEGSAVRLMMTLAVPADEVLFAVFSARSAHIVSEACRRAGVPAQRVSSAVSAAIPSRS
ncbi:MAG TPA: hypothetical protein VFA16_01480 [Mycobacterium sp.]|uniref:hypothetical protein n=1 Tax=Mycobacterium sp. TaxID=1785 RepID=UPI002D3F4990|nr:hypothetical protein [Mycobacterium sp.]HZU45919.1 hypothetical protein [Mycobacterium sp.]